MDSISFYLFLFLMRVDKPFIFFFFICSLTNVAAAQVIKAGKWSGWIKQGETAYTYTLQINSIIGDSLFGTSTSKSKDFFCETKFKGVQQKDKWYVNETVVVRTNYKGTGSVCLMKLLLTRSGERLQGTFTSSSKELKDCGSGTVGLQFIPERLIISPSKDSVKQIGQVQSQRQVKPVFVIKDQQVAAPLIQSKKTPILPQRILEKREIDLINTFTFDEDSIMLKLYDNGVVDGDIISLVVNEKIVLDKVKLTANPIAFPLKIESTDHFLIEFFAENLGDIPPNTGLVVLSGISRQNEVVFSSNLKKTSAFRVILKKKE